MTTYTISDIRAMGPCYDPVTGINKDGTTSHEGGFLPEGWEGTALDVLNIAECPLNDRLWVMVRMDVPDSIWRKFARWSALQVIDLWAAPPVVREYLETGKEELRAAAETAAWAAARAAGAAEWAAARAAWAAGAAGAATGAAWAARTAAEAAKDARAIARAAKDARAIARAAYVAQAAELRRLLEEGE